MPTYYEIINVVPTASRPEIEQALDVQYNRWRRLVTHHDPDVVNQANQALQALEKVRAVLTDPGKRSAYDAAVSSVVSGLEDPAAHPPIPEGLPVPPGQMASGPQPFPHHLPPTQSSALRTWMCPKCQSPNVVNSQFCKTCGESLAISCPICSKLVEIGAQFCTNCGVSIPQAQHKKELEVQCDQYRAKLENTERYVPVPEANLADMKKQVFYAGVWAVVAFSGGISYIFGLLGNLPGVNLAGLFFTASRNFNPPVTGASDVLWAAILLVVLAVVVIFLSIAKRLSPLRGVGAAVATLLFMALPKTAYAVLIKLGLEPTGAAMAVLLMSAFIYTILLVILLSVTRRNYTRLKPFNQRLPNLGILGALFGLALLAVPLLYCAYFILFVSDMTGHTLITHDIEFYVWLVNIIQLFALGLILAGYVVIGWTTSQGIESRYTQAVLLRETSIGKLIQQIKSLEHAISAINLHPQ